MTSKPDSLDTATTRLHGLIVTARAENPGIAADSYLDALALWVAVVPNVRDVLSTLEVPAATLGEVEFIYREAMTAWLQGTPPFGAVYADDPAMADDELEHRIRTALDPPADWVF